MIEVTIIPTEHVHIYAPKIAHLLGKSEPYSHGRYRLEDMLYDCLIGQHQLWVVFEKISGSNELNFIAAFTTRISVYPRLRALCCQFCGGSRMKEWAAKAQTLLENYAADNKCTLLEMSGRDGWEKVLAPLGWRPAFKVYEKALSNDT